MLSIPAIGPYFTSEKMQTYIDADKDNNYKKYLISKTFKAALFHADPTNFNYELVKIECVKLRLFLYADMEKANKYIEINLFDFIPDLLFSLHDELNKEIKKNNEDGSNNINSTDYNNDNKVDFTNELSVLKASVKDYLEKYRSKISDQFYFLIKITEECFDCQKNIKFSTSVNYACVVFPDRTTIYVNRKEISVIDLLKHYCKKRPFNNVDIYCPYCGKKQNNINRTKNLYTSPLNLIIELDYNDKDENKFKLNIDELINIQEFVERKDISKLNYRLVGAVFMEKNDNENRKYVSITKNENGQWYYFNGNSIQYSSLNNLINHERVKMLIYSSI